MSRGKRGSLSSDEIAGKLFELERDLASTKEDLRKNYPGVEKVLDRIALLEKCIDETKSLLKEVLVMEDDYDIHEKDGRKYSASKVVKLAVKNIDLVPDSFKSMMEVANEEKAKNYYKLNGVPPEGFEDRSYVKLNLKDA